MNRYDPSMYTWGSEIEFGDVPKKFHVPPQIGSWEYSETDILNLREPYRGIAADPKGINPPMGGEINFRPSKTWKDQVDRILEMVELFRQAGYEPTTSFISHTHVHVHVPGMIEDIEALRRLTRYVQANQETIIRRVGQYRDLPEIEKGKNAKMYLKLDGGRPIPSWLCDNLATKATSFKDFIDLHCMGKDGVSRGRPLRFAINMYSLKNTKTVEMRLFRASLNREHLESCFRFTEAMMNAALNGGPSADEILDEGVWNFPPFDFDLALWNAHQATKHEPGGAAGKNRHFWIAT